MTIEANHYVLAVHDVKASAKFYVDVLGFAIAMEPPGWIFVKRDNVMIMLGECADAMHPGTLGDHNYFAYLRVDDVDAFHAHVCANGPEYIHHPLADKPWAMREFGVRTIDGHRIMIGQQIA